MTPELLKLLKELEAFGQTNDDAAENPIARYMSRAAISVERVYRSACRLNLEDNKVTVYEKQNKTAGPVRRCGRDAGPRLRKRHSVG